MCLTTHLSSPRAYGAESPGNSFLPCSTFPSEPPGSVEVCCSVHYQLVFTIVLLELGSHVFQAVLELALELMPPPPVLSAFMSQERRAVSPRLAPGLRYASLTRSLSLSPPSHHDYIMLCCTPAVAVFTQECGLRTKAIQPWQPPL